jgi:hypothetical protein
MTNSIVANKYRSTNIAYMLPYVFRFVDIDSGAVVGFHMGSEVIIID